MKNYYDILGLETNASFDEIKAAYKALVKKFHPDVNSQQREFFEKKSKSINEAYEILSNPSKKSNYDMRLKEFLNRQHNNQANSNYNQQKEEDLKRREEELRKKQNENDRRQREKEEELKRKQDDFDRKQREEELRKKQNENEKRQREKETNRKPIFISIGILLFLVAGFGMYKLGQQKTEVVDEAIIQADSVPSIGVSTEDLVVENTENEEVATTTEEKMVKDGNLSHKNSFTKEKSSNEKTISNSQNSEKQIIKHNPLGNYTEGLALFKSKEGYYGFVDKKGREIIEAKYQKLNNFSEGLADAVYNGMWGFIDKEGKVIIDFQYDKVRSFHENLCVVFFKGNYGVINRKGDIIIPFEYQYQSISDFQQGVAVVRKNSKCALIDSKHNFITPMEYEYIEELSEGVRVATKKIGERSRTGYINNEGHVVIPFQFHYGGSFKNGVAEVTSHGMSDFFKINKNGSKIDF